MLCWGSWANLQKLTGKWRYELFYWDFSIGAGLVGILAAFTLGSMDSKALTFQDNLLIASYHKIAYGLGAGVVLNLANVLLTAGLSVAPLSVVFPVAFGMAAVVGAAWSLVPPQGSVLLVLGGVVLVLVAVVVNAFAYGTYAQEQRSGTSALTPDARNPARVPSAAKPPLPSKGVTLSVVSGIVMGMVPPLLTSSRTGEDGLGAYSAGLLFGIATLVSTLIYAPFFTAFSVHGAPVQFRAYFKGSKAQHFCGLLAGGLWSTGLIASFVTGGTMALIEAGPVATRGFAEGAAILAALWGLLVWREFRGGSDRVRILLSAMLILWAVGGALLAMAPGFAK
jgi:glucose uptake protein